MMPDRLRGNRYALSRSTVLRGLGRAAVIAARPARLSHVNRYAGDINGAVWLALLWQKCDFWDSQGGKSLIHREPAFAEAGDGSRVAERVGDMAFAVRCGVTGPSPRSHSLRSTGSALPVFASAVSLPM